MQLFSCLSRFSVSLLHAALYGAAGTEVGPGQPASTYIGTQISLAQAFASTTLPSGRRRGCGCFSHHCSVDPLIGVSLIAYRKWVLVWNRTSPERVVAQRTRRPHPTTTHTRPMTNPHIREVRRRCTVMTPFPNPTERASCSS